MPRGSTTIEFHLRGGFVMAKLARLLSHNSPKPPIDAAVVKRP
jgi:hypothetical protein